jgi:hypothetical protein
MGRILHFKASLLVHDLISRKGNELLKLKASFLGAFLFRSSFIKYPSFLGIYESP